jgi:hypothetical protein
MWLEYLDEEKILGSIDSEDNSAVLKIFSPLTIPMT